MAFVGRRPRSGQAGLAEGDNDASLAALASEAAAGLDSMGQVERATMAHAVAGRYGWRPAASTPG